MHVIKDQTFKKEQVFFSHSFNVSLQFEKNGRLQGEIIHFPTLIHLTKHFEGLYLFEESSVKIAFMIEWSNSNLTSKALTSFSGLIIPHSPNFDALVLRWFQINESIYDVGSFVEKDFEVLFDFPIKDPSTEVKKILSILPAYSFD